MARYGYAAFFAVMAGGVTAGIAGVLIGALSEPDPGWAPAASGGSGLALALIAFFGVLRASENR